MVDMSDYTVTISHEDVEEIVREELKEVIRSHKKEMIQIEKSGGILDEHEDYINSKALIHAAAVVLHYYSVPSEWAAIKKIQEEHEDSA